VVTKQGDRVTGVPKISANLTNVYTFQDSVLKGLRLGGSSVTYWQSSPYYYYPAGVGQPNNRALWFPAQLASLLGYFRIRAPPSSD
jgi:hypothetical protein